MSTINYFFPSHLPAQSLPPICTHCPTYAMLSYAVSGLRSCLILKVKILLTICVLHSAIAEVVMFLPRSSRCIILKTEAKCFYEAFDTRTPNYTASHYRRPPWESQFPRMRSCVWRWRPNVSLSGSAASVYNLPGP